MTAAMDAASILQRTMRAARVRVALRTTAFALPAVAAIAAVAWRWGTVGWSASIAVLGLVAAFVLAWIAARRIDARWLARSLDERDPRMEDSAALLFAGSAITPLQRLQQTRLQNRLESAPPQGLRPAWRKQVLLASTLAAALVIAIALAWPTPPPPTQLAPTPAPSAPIASAATHTQVTWKNLEISPPAYTRLPRRSEEGFEARVPEGSTLRWTLRFQPAPTAAKLAFHDGREVALTRHGEDWIASRRIDKAVLYRVVLDAAPPLRPDRLHRIDVVVDQPPELKVIAPDDTLTLRGAAQRAWSLSFEARDDYGLASTAPLRITLAQGDGENVTFSERSLSLPGRGSAARKRYAHTFDLAALAMSPGDDLVVQLSVDDNRPDRPQTTRSASYILRWPKEDAAEATGLDGLVKKALPAYFRSQRQIIIDSEALLAQRRKLPAETFVARSDAIGVDQRLLRLRYGQFLGEESEGAPRRLLPTADAEAEAGAEHADAQHADDEQHHDEADQRDVTLAAPSADAHEHEEAPAPPGFGHAEDVLESYGHTHDDAEAATLLDPETRKTLKAALDQMWQAELHLRQGHPDQALPYEYKALDYIKQVQQTGRVYLARVGNELPPIDEGRRLSGDRKGLAPRSDALAAATPSSPVLAALWQVLQVPQGTDVPARRLEAAERWLRANEARVPDALGVIAAIDGVRREPDCASCRQLLRSRLWPLLPRPPAKPLLRARPDRSGQAYLDALDEGLQR